jgi:hypothetical protein
MYTSVIQHFGKDRAGSFIKGFAPKLTEYLIAVKDNSSIIDKELNIISFYKTSSTIFTKMLNN